MDSHYVTVLVACAIALAPVIVLILISHYFRCRGALSTQEHNQRKDEMRMSFDLERGLAEIRHSHEMESSERWVPRTGVMPATEKAAQDGRG